MDTVSLRVQQLALADQALVLSRLSEGRMESGRFAPKVLEGLFDELGLPRPGNVANLLLRLEASGHVARLKEERGSWRLTPKGKAKSFELVDGMDLAELVAEGRTDVAPDFARTTHPTMPPWLAPPDLLRPLRDFIGEHPFDRNVFGMTRFPDEQDESKPDPVGGVLDVARNACADHGLEFHLASDRRIVDDLWSNVDAHMWACKYGIGFFEDRRGRGINYNLTIEVGGMLTIGRRLALLKDVSIDRMPADLIGKIYSSVDFNDLKTVDAVVHAWLRADLRLGPCTRCTSGNQTT